LSQIFCQELKVDFNFSRTKLDLTFFVWVLFASLKGKREQCFGKNKE